MKIVKMVKFEKDDSQILNRIIESCNMAASFFMEDRLGMDNSGDRQESGLRAISRLRAGHPLEAKHITEAYEEADKALARVRGAKTGGVFPAELKDGYQENLMAVCGILRRWKEALNEEDVQLDACQMP